MNPQCYCCGVSLTPENTHELYSHQSGMCLGCWQEFLEFTDGEDKGAVEQRNEA